MLGVPQDFELNFGGIVGAAIFVAGAIAILFIVSRQGQIPPVGALPIVVAASVGGVLGNRIWKLAMPNERNDL